jgi:hypothetical protein
MCWNYVNRLVAACYKNINGNSDFYTGKFIN